MHSIESEIESTKAFFKTKRIPFSEEWLDNCLEWFREEKKNVPYTESELHSTAYDQWRTSDMREARIPQLPNNVQNITKLVLNKPLILQMQSIVDISKPRLQQLNKIKNSNPLTRNFDGAEVNDSEQRSTPQNNRMLQMILTDGVEEVKAVEYRNIPELDVNLRPGIKLRIVPPVTLRRGTLMLERKNLELLGGEVRELLIVNASENVLANGLNLPLNLNLSLSKKEVNSDPVVGNPIVVYKSNEINHRNNNENNVRKVKQSDISNYFKNEIISKELELQSKTIQKPQDEESRIEEEIDYLLETEREFETHSKKIQKQKESLIEEEIDCLLETEREFETHSKPIQKPEQEESRIAEEIDSLLETERELELESLTIRKPEQKQTPNELSLNDIINSEDDLFADFQEPEIYSLKELKEKIERKEFGTFTTFAKFKSVVKKLTVGSKGWELRICVCSDETDLTVNVSNGTIVELIGYTHEQVIEMKKEAQKKNPEAMGLIMKALDGLRVKLMELNSIMEIEYKSEEELPNIILLG